MAGALATKEADQSTCYGLPYRGGKPYVHSMKCNFLTTLQLDALTSEADLMVTLAAVANQPKTKPALVNTNDDQGES